MSKHGHNRSTRGVWLWPVGLAAWTACQVPSLAPAAKAANHAASTHEALVNSQTPVAMRPMAVEADPNTNLVQAGKAPVVAGQAAPVQPLTRIRKAIDLNLAGSHPPATVTLPQAVAHTLAATTVPVLLPDWAAVVGAWQATAEADWYTLTATLDGVTWVVQGDRVATVDPELAPAGWQPPTWQQPYLSRNELIAEATFLAYGASYSISVECADPEHDVRCTGDAAVQEAVASLRRCSAGGAR